MPILFYGTFLLGVPWSVVDIVRSAGQGWEDGLLGCVLGLAGVFLSAFYVVLVMTAQTR